MTLLDGSPALAKACQGVTTQDVQQLWGQPVTDHDYGTDKTRCGWHLTPPASPYVPADITITTGYPARIATATLTGAAVTAKFGGATILIPQHTPVPGSAVAAENITQPIQITYRYTYPAKSTAATITATDNAAAAKVTQLAQHLAGRLPQGPGADNTALTLNQPAASVTHSTA